MKAKQQMVTLGAPLDSQPHEALRGVLRATAGHVAWLNVEISSLDLGDEEAQTLMNLYGEERDRLTRVAKACIDSGMSKVEVEIRQRQSEAMAQAVDNAFKVMGGVSEEQRKQFRTALRLELQELQKAAPERQASA